MSNIADLVRYFDSLAPPELAESWDNTGLLVGDPDRPVQRVMTCLTITPESAGEAVAGEVDLIVAHHPLPFRPLTKINTTSTVGRLLWDLIGARIAVYSPHTRFDSAARGINFQIASRIGLVGVQPLRAVGEGNGDETSAVGAGRWGVLAEAAQLRQLVGLLKSQFAQETIEVVGSATAAVQRVAIACGSGGSLLEDALAVGCDTLITGEASFHTALECRARGIQLVLIGHFASERFALELLAEELGRAFPRLNVWASRNESDPIARL